MTVVDLSSPSSPLSPITLAIPQIISFWMRGTQKENGEKTQKKIIGIIQKYYITSRSSKDSRTQIPVFQLDKPTLFVQFTFTVCRPPAPLLLRYRHKKKKVQAEVPHHPLLW